MIYTERLTKLYFEAESMSINSANVTSMLDHLLEGYDVRLRPNFGGERN